MRGTSRDGSSHVSVALEVGLWARVNGPHSRFGERDAESDSFAELGDGVSLGVEGEVGRSLGVVLPALVVPVDDMGQRAPRVRS